MESARYVMLHVIFNQHMHLVAVPGTCFDTPSETLVELLFFSIAYNYLKEMLMRSRFFSFKTSLVHCSFQMNTSISKWILIYLKGEGTH